MDQQSFAPTVITPEHQHGRRGGTGRSGGLVAVPSAVPSLQRLALPAPSAPEAPSTCLGPAEDFPSALAELGLTELQVLHSRVARQLEREYCTDPAGPHPVTLDRAEELVAELDTRQEFLDPPAIAATQARPAPAEAPDDTRTGRRRAPAPRRHDEGLDALFRRRAGSIDPADVRVADLDRLQPGDEIEVWHREQRQCTGVVEQTAAALGVLWIREAVDGYRRMVCAHDVVLRYCPRHEPR